MVKRVLLISFLFFSCCIFSQKKSIQELVATPNPFSTSTIISFNSESDQGVFLIVKNVLGKVVYRKAYFAKKGTKEIVFNRRELKSGMYIYAIQTNNCIVSKRFVIK